VKELAVINVKIKRRRRQNRLGQRKIIFLALLTLTGLLVANIIQYSRRQSHEALLSANQEQIATSGLKQQVDFAKVLVTQLEEKTFAVPPAFQGKTIYQVKPISGEKVVALTFDDGPWPQTTPQVLEILKKNNIKATFFLVGQTLQNYPQIARQVVDEGHVIGNHTWHHRYNRVSEQEAAKEIEDTAALLYKTTGIKTAYFRPPGGGLRNGLAAYAQKHKYAVMMWSVDSNDSHRRRPSASTLVNNVIKATKPGGVVLLHDGGGNHSETVKALPEIIERFKQQGYKFVTLPELLNVKNQESTELKHPVSTEGETDQSLNSENSLPNQEGSDKSINPETSIPSDKVPAQSPSPQ